MRCQLGDEHRVWSALRVFGGFVGAVHKVNACGRRNVGFLGDTMGDVVVHWARCFNVIVTRRK